MLKRIRRFFDKFLSGRDRAQHFNVRYGKWFVKYNDGNQSENMAYNVACDYAEIFGGKVLHIEERDAKKTHQSGEHQPVQ